MGKKNLKIDALLPTIEKPPVCCASFKVEKLIEYSNLSSNSYKMDYNKLKNLGMPITKEEGVVYWCQEVSTI